MFGTKHIIILVVSLILIVGLYFVTRKWKFSTICKSLFAIGIVSEIIKIFFYIVRNEEKFGGVLPKTDLPFHLCSIQIILIAVICISKNEKFKRMILSFMLPSCLFGGIAAILIPTTTALGSWIITFQYFLYHIALVIFSLHIFTTKEFKLTVKDYKNCLIFLLGLMFFAIYINSIIYDGESNINFMYVVGPPQEGLPFLNKDKGWLVYILRYAGLILTCVTLTYIKPIIYAIKSKFTKKEIHENKLEESSEE
ncbi:MAG: YwaF family protein [Clostridia bacterium]|nr:YwaF family protein [Clostridia bacterium]